MLAPPCGCEPTREAPKPGNSVPHLLSGARRRAGSATDRGGGQRAGAFQRRAYAEQLASVLGQNGAKRRRRGQSDHELDGLLLRLRRGLELPDQRAILCEQRHAEVLTACVRLTRGCQVHGSGVTDTKLETRCPVIARAVHGDTNAGAEATSELPAIDPLNPNVRFEGTRRVLEPPSKVDRGFPVPGEDPEMHDASRIMTKIRRARRSVRRLRSVTAPRPGQNPGQEVLFIVGPRIHRFEAPRRLSIESGLFSGLTLQCSEGSPNNAHSTSLVSRPSSSSVRVSSNRRAPQPLSFTIATAGRAI
jgi:hypothetical protein